MKIELSRQVRFCVNGDGSLAVEAARSNTFAAWPPMRGLGRYYVLEVILLGDVNPITGYFMNIKRVDQAVREDALDKVALAVVNGKDDFYELLKSMSAALNASLDGGLVELRLFLTPTYWIGFRTKDHDAMLITQKFDFAAAHRLHVNELSAGENVSVFGKCNNPNGHGHNYQMEVSVRVPAYLQSQANGDGESFVIEQLDDLVNETLIERYDHKHLNQDLPEFAALNPSVENMVCVFVERLKPALAQAGIQLDALRLWETEKTSATWHASYDTVEA